jgi:Rod binding domain-containing protein
MSANINGFSSVPVDLGAARDASVSTPKVTQTADPALAAKTGHDFEAMFLSQMLQPMFEGVNKSNSYFGGGHGEEAFSSMLVDEYGKAMADHGGVGVAKMVAETILKSQTAVDQARAQVAHLTQRVASAQPQASAEPEAVASSQAATAEAGAEQAQGKPQTAKDWKPLDLEEFGEQPTVE